MNSKRFVISIVLIIFSLIGIIYAALWILPEEKYMQGEYGAWKQQKEYSLQKHAREVILLGDSRMKIDVNAVELDNTYNMALAGASPMESYYTLKRYLTAGNIPHAVYIGFAPTHFTSYENYLERGLFFHYYDENEIREININIMKYDGKDYTSEAYKYIWRSPAVYLTALLHSFKEDRELLNFNLYEEMQRCKGTLTMNVKKKPDALVQPEETKEKHFKLKRVLDYYLGQTIIMCKDNHIPVYIVQLPMSDYGVELLKSTGYMQQYENYMQTLADDYGISVEIHIPVYPDELFADNSHLNKQGQQQYTRYMKDLYDRKEKNQ